MQEFPDFSLIEQLNPIRAPLWARGGHAQTVLGHILPSPKIRNFADWSRLEIPLRDGDRLHAYQSVGGYRSTHLLLLHGLGGSIQADYIQRTALLLMKLGYPVTIVNHRGADEGRGLAKNSYHSGRFEDAADVIRFLRLRERERLREGKRGSDPKMFAEESARLSSSHRQTGLQIGAIGFSMSGSILLNLAGRSNDPTELPDWMISVNAPLNLHDCSMRLGQGFNRIYDFRFVKRLNHDILGFAEAGGFKPESGYPSPWRTTVRDFDQLYTAPANGFRDRDDYYSRCSSFQVLHQIKIPTLCLTAEDDPIASVEFYRSARTSPSVRVHVAATGGHMGYIQNPNARLVHAKAKSHGFRWLDYVLHELLDGGRLTK